MPRVKNTTTKKRATSSSAEPQVTFLQTNHQRIKYTNQVIENVLKMLPKKTYTAPHQLSYKCPKDLDSTPRPMLVLDQHFVEEIPYHDHIQVTCAFCHQPQGPFRDMNKLPLHYFEQPQARKRWTLSCERCWLQRIPHTRPETM